MLSVSSSWFYYAKEAVDYSKNILSASDAEVKIEYNDSNATFSFDNYILMCRLIDGKYPNYEAVTKRESNKLMIDRSQFWVPYVVAFLQ
jgi:DNA polymerase-3 subunit beta